jgi:O-antigen/teichoic acid export membrane protein
MENLKEKTAKGLMWGAVNNGTMQILNLLIGIIILRHVTPADTGLIGMLAIFTAIAGNLQSSGFSTALINEKQPTPQQYNSVFWFNVLMGGLLYAVLFASAPLISWFFRQPRLTDLSRFLFLSFFISSFGISTHAYMVKNMMNREITIINLTALVVSGTTAIVMALNDMAYWSLAWQQVVNSLVLILGRFYYVKWKPSLRFTFDFIRQSFSFSMKILVTMIINTVNQNMLTVIFGRLFRDARVVGNFFQAFKWDSMAFQTVGGMVGQVAQPVLVTVREEKEREQQVFRKMLRFTAFLSFPALFGLAMVAREFILCTIGEKWADCVPLLQILCISGAFMPIYTLYQNLVISHGRSDINMWLNIGQIAVQMAVILLFYRQGITVMVMAYTIFNILWLAVWQPFAKRIIGLRFVQTAKDIAPFAMIAAVVMLVTHYVTLPITSLWLLLFTRIALAAALYYGMMRLLHVAILNECLQFIRKK